MAAFKHFLVAQVVLFFCAFSLCGEELPTYKFIDLGLFETDHSHAKAINEKGQVLGTFEIDRTCFTFLWDAKEGLKIIDNPNGNGLWEVKFNNKAQIAFIGENPSNQGFNVYLWDKNVGFWLIENIVWDKKDRKEALIVDFNDKGQILGQISDQTYLWDHGKKINLTALFKEQMPGDWTDLRASSLNNHGHVAFSAYKPKVQGCDEWGRRSFLWQDGTFKMIMPEKNWETSVQDVILDDAGNMIACTYPRSGGHGAQYFITSSGQIFSCSGCDVILNGRPLAKRHLPGKLKKNAVNQDYFTQGIEIKKLMKEEFPYYEIAHTLEISDQNSKGYVVGSVNTITGYHAFLAIPECKK